MEQTYAMEAIRMFFAAVDRTIYGLITTVYQIILSLADNTIISSAVIEDLYTRMYTLLGIFMLFKITFSFINYIINPDSFTDKQKGVQKLALNTIIVLILIIITPFAFDKLYEAQNAILVDNLLPKFILGQSSTDNVIQNPFSMSEECDNYETGNARSDADYLALMTFRPFFQLEEKTKGLVDNGFMEEYCSFEINLTTSSFLKSSIYNETKDNIYVVDYKFLISTITGLVVVLILISFCFDISVRAIKLAFLQMIAPIPILSYIDPNSSKNSMLSKWIKQVATTWVSLFIRLAAIFIAVLVISKLEISNSDNNFWVMLFIIIGALIFAKQLPKLLEELFPGLKLGGLQLNPFKKVANDALGGKTLLGLWAGALGLGLGSLSSLGSFITSKLAMEKEKNEIPEKSESYNKFKKHLDNFREKKGMSDEQYNKFLNNKLESEQQKIRDKYRENYSFRHPILSNFSQTLSGAKIAFNQGKNLKFDPIEIGKQSAQVRDYKDKYSIKDRAMDKATDFFGVKNESGTTSQVKKDIKDQTDLLTRINRNIEMQNRTVSELQSKIGASNFNAAVSMDAKGNYVLNPGYEHFAGAEAANLKSVIDQLASLEQQRLDVTKSINRLEKTRDQKPPKPGK